MAELSIGPRTWRAVGNMGSLGRAAPLAAPNRGGWGQRGRRETDGTITTEDGETQPRQAEAMAALTERCGPRADLCRGHQPWEGDPLMWEDSETGAETPKKL